MYLFRYRLSRKNPGETGSVDFQGMQQIEERNYSLLSIFRHPSAVFCPLISDKRLRPPGAGYGFRQNSMNLIQQVAGVHALWKRLSMVTLQTRALDQIANFKVELVV
jgi:hypothetical protein